MSDSLQIESPEATGALGETAVQHDHAGTALWSEVQGRIL